MPFKDKEKKKEYQRKWMENKRRSKGIEKRPIGEDPEKVKLRKYRYRFGEYAEAFIEVINLERSFKE